MTKAIGRQSLHDMPMSPALFLVLRAQLRGGKTDLPFNDAQLVAAFRRYVGKNLDKKAPADDRELARLANTLVKRDVNKKQAAPKTITPIQRQALVLMGVAVPAAQKKNQKPDKAENSDDADDVIDEKPAAAMAEKLLDFARGAEPADAVAAVMLAKNFTDAPSFGVKSCDVLLDKYGTRATNANEKHLILDGIAHVSDDHDRRKMADRFDTLAANEKDAELNTKILALKQDARDLLKTHFGENGVQIIGKGQAGPDLTFLPEQKPIFSPVGPRKRGPFDLPDILAGPKPPSFPDLSDKI
jgi:hypothetical protein